MALNGSLCNHPPLKVACLQYLPYIFFEHAPERDRDCSASLGGDVYAIDLHASFTSLSVWAILIIAHTVASNVDNR